MPSVSKWMTSKPLASAPQAQTQIRAQKALERINDNPESIIFTTPAGTDLAAQTVRLDFDNSITQAGSDAGVAALRALVILGIKDHETEPDTDIKTGYVFWLDKRQYRVQQVNNQQIGQIEAKAEVVN